MNDAPCVENQQGRGFGRFGATKALRQVDDLATGQRLQKGETWCSPYRSRRLPFWRAGCSVMATPPVQYNSTTASSWKPIKEFPARSCLSSRSRSEGSQGNSAVRKTCGACLVLPVSFSLACDPVSQGGPPANQPPPFAQLPVSRRI